MTKKEPVIGLYPLNDCVLVELKQSYKNFSAKEGKYDSRTEGVVVAVPENILNNFTMEFTNNLINKRVHFEEFKEGARIKRDGKIYSFIKIEDIRGYEIEPTS
jgi:co-chaperonin GroES (HSP10)